MVCLLINYGNVALNQVREFAKTNNSEQKLYLAQICKEFDVDIDILLQQVLSNSVTINFHIDRFSANGKTIIENLTEQGMYHGQFRTGTSNGGLGGNRLNWEQCMFSNAYPEAFIDRPKYGALNIFKFADGASLRFGSCFFTLKKHMLKYCTFSYGDSSTNPTTLCTSDTFEGILADLLKDVEINARMLNQIVSSKQEALAILLHNSNMLKILGRNLDFCIETHIHSDISLEHDVDDLYIDESYCGTSLEQQAYNLCKKFNINLKWIPKRQINVEEVGSLFRGPKIPALARKIDDVFGERQGIINAYLIGKASCDSYLNIGSWSDIGNTDEMFQRIKQLWHTVGYFG